MAEREGSEALDTGQPVWDLGHGGRALDMPPTPPNDPVTGHRPRVRLASTAPAHGSNAGTPGDATSGEAPTQGPPQAHAESDARATTPDTPKRATDRGPSPGEDSRDEDSFDAFMEFCRSASQTDPAPTAPRSHPEARGDHTEPARVPPIETLPVSCQAHPQRDYAALGARTEYTAATDDGQATASRAADQTPDEPPRHGAPGSGMRLERGTNTARKPAEQPPLATPAGGRGHLDYPRSEEDARRPNTHAEQAAAQDLDLWINRITTGERLALGVSIRWLLTSHSRHLEDGTRTMADVAFAIGQNHTHPPPPWTTPGNGTTLPPGSWHIWGPIARMK